MKFIRILPDLILIGVIMVCGASFLFIVWLFWNGVGQLGSYHLTVTQEILGLSVVVPLFLVLFIYAMYTLMQDIKREKLSTVQNTKLSPAGVTVALKNITIITRKKNLIVLTLILFVEFLFFALLRY